MNSCANSASISISFHQRVSPTHAESVFVRQHASDQLQFDFRLTTRRGASKREPFVIMQRIAVASHPQQTAPRGFHFDDGPLVLVAVQSKRVQALAHQAVEKPGKFHTTTRPGCPDSARTILGQLSPFPDFHFVSRSRRRGSPSVFLIGIGKEQQNRLFLFRSPSGRRYPSWRASQACLGVRQRDVVGVNGDQRVCATIAVAAARGSR